MKYIKRFVWSGGRLLQGIGGVVVGGLVNLLVLSDAHATSSNIPPAPTVSITNTSDIICYLKYGFDLMFWLLIALAAVMVMVGAYNYLTAQGDAEKVSKGTKTLMWAAIAVAVALIAWNVPDIVASFFGANLNQSTVSC